MLLDRQTEGLTLLTADEVAARFRTSRWGVLNLRRVGKLQGVLIGRRLRFDPRDVDDCLERIRANRPGVGKA